MTAADVAKRIELILYFLEKKSVSKINIKNQLKKLLADLDRGE